VTSGANADLSLCSVDNFSPSKWLTLGRTDLRDTPNCPLVGEYTGVLPDAEGLCAKSYADCNNPEIMFYTVFNCHNQSEVYEEREYRCFGQWEEAGLVYTYTRRRDVPGSECFVGVTLDDERNVVTEAGENCERGHQPTKYGMTLRREGRCPHEMRHQHVPHVSSTESSPEAEETSEEESLEREMLTERPISPRFSTAAVPAQNPQDADGGGRYAASPRKHHKTHHEAGSGSSVPVASAVIAFFMAAVLLL
jgi:hypothetical protein